jgi:uncharacterized protein YqjF (DUF2071 family)
MMMITMYSFITNFGVDTTWKDLFNRLINAFKEMGIRTYISANGKEFIAFNDNDVVSVKFSDYEVEIRIFTETKEAMKAMALIDTILDSAGIDINRFNIVIDSCTR